MSGIEKHDNLVDKVEQELIKRGYKDIEKFVSYRRPHDYNYLGEIDIYATRGRYVLLFEVKTHDTRDNKKHAYRQMDRAVKNYFKDWKHYNRVFTFYVHGDKNNDISYEWLKH